LAAKRRPESIYNSLRTKTASNPQSSEMFFNQFNWHQVQRFFTRLTHNLRTC